MYAHQTNCTLKVAVVQSLAKYIWIFLLLLIDAKNIDKDGAAECVHMKYTQLMDKLRQSLIELLCEKMKAKEKASG